MTNVIGDPAYADTCESLKQELRGLVTEALGM